MTGKETSLGELSTAATTLTSEEKHRALEHALQSRTFVRSDQLKTFLRFVCEAEDEGRSEAISEYVIGVEVLGRSEGYSPAEDSSVRTRAYELRHKLERLYSLESPDAAIQIVLPKGGYKPLYVKRAASRIQETAVPAPPADISGGGNERSRIGANPWARLIPAALTIAAAALGSGVTWLALKQPAPKPSVDPVVTEAWGPLAKPNANALLCIATPLHLVVGPATHDTYGGPAYPAPPETPPLFLQHRPLPPGTALGLSFTDNSMGIGATNAVVIAANTLSSMGGTYQILPERVAPASTLRKRNAILFGAPVDSDAITRILETTPLTVDYEPSVKEFVIRDRQKGNFLVPKKDANGEFIDVYGLLTVMNNRDSDRGRLGMVVFSGITSTGTHAAAEFFASPRCLRDLRSRFGKEGINGFPAAYQVVVRSMFGNKLLLTYEYHSHKILDKD